MTIKSMSALGLNANEQMHNRIKKIITDPKEQEKLERDYIYTFQNLGLSEVNAQKLCGQLVELLGSERELNEIESHSLKLLESTEVVNVEGRAQTLPQILDQKLADRAEVIFDQIERFASQIKGRILDYGTGDGQVAQLLRDHLGLQMEGVDIRDYRKEGVNIPFRLLEGSQLEVRNSIYSGAILTNVLHHEAHNGQILRELKRVVKKGGKVIVLETVPAGQTEAEMEVDKDRTFANDYLYNRLFHNADIPVPGSFETIIGWKKRFYDHAMSVILELDLGFDQPTIRDRHYLYILEV